MVRRGVSQCQHIVQHLKVAGETLTGVPSIPHIHGNWDIKTQLTVATCKMRRSSGLSK